MEQHPFLKELLNVCAAHNVEPAEAYTTFEVYQELCLGDYFNIFTLSHIPDNRITSVFYCNSVRKLSDLKYFFNNDLRMFYLTGKTSPTDEDSNVYIPVMYNDEMTIDKIDSLQEVLSPRQKQCYLFIRDRDSSSACYCITKGLVKPDSPDTCKRKKEIEEKKYHFEKTIQANRKLFYMEALKEKKLKVREFSRK